MADSDAEKLARECYDLTENQEAFDCLKALAKPSEGNTCPVRLVLFTQKNCVPCKEELARLADDIASGAIQEASVDTTEGLALAEKAGISYVPAIAVLDCNDNPIDPA